MCVGVAGPATAPSALPFVEIVETFESCPTAEESAGWRRPGRTFGVVASQLITHPRSGPSARSTGAAIPEHAAVGHFTHSRWTDEAWARTDAAARALDAPVILFRTPASFRATAEHEERLENFVALAARAGLTLAWEWAPRSWPDARAIAFAEHLCIAAAVDPTERAAPSDEVVYLRVTGGAGGKRSPSDDDMKRIWSEVNGRCGWVVFANATAEQDAQRLAALL